MDFKTRAVADFTIKQFESSSEENFVIADVEAELGSSFGRWQ